MATGVRAGLWRARGAFQTQWRVMPLWGVIRVLAVDPGDAKQQRIGKAIWGQCMGAMSQPPRAERVSLGLMRAPVRS